jgi:murein DD-endopeptidase MepM/ murein hydrolase activator NlpD
VAGVQDHLEEEGLLRLMVRLGSLLGRYAAWQQVLLATLVFVVAGPSGVVPQLGTRNTALPPPSLDLSADDDVLMAQMPEIDLQALLAGEAGESWPFLGLAPSALPVHGGYARLESAPSWTTQLTLPDTLLLYSGTWLGRRTTDAAARLGLALTNEQIEMVQDVAVARGVNVRYLLTLARVKDASTRFETTGDWQKWLMLETARVRSVLGPFSEGATAAVGAHPHAMVIARPEDVAPATLSLLVSLGAGQSLAEAEGAIDDFLELYAAAFGAPDRDEAQPAAGMPFLYRPFTTALLGQGYYDHLYPSVDYGRVPNVPGMLDYLGRTNTHYDSHDADDFWIPFGSDVIAPTGGTVLWVDNVPPDLGLLIRPYGTTYDVVIVHLSALYVGLNQHVQRGQLLGLSGRAQIDHIHFEVRHNGKQTDTRGWYGGGSDPCPAGPGAISGGYRGCEASVWLWADESPPSGGSPCRRAATLNAPTEGARDAKPAAMPDQIIRIFLPLIGSRASC